MTEHKNMTYNINVVYVEITNQCNFNCRTCYNRSGLNQKRQELSLEQIEGILQLFSHYGLKRFLLSGGEPSLHTEFDRILDLVDKYPEISFGIVTNGSNHHPKLIEYLNTRENLTLQISLDGSCEEVNALTRGAGHFAQTLAFVQKIHKTNPRPLLKMVISQNNYEDVADFCHLALSHDFTPELAFIYRSGNGSLSWEDKALTARQKADILRLVEKLNQEQNADIFLPLCTSKCPFAGKSQDLSISIKVDGSIQPCQGLYDPGFTLGNALTFDEAVFTERMNRICDLAKERTKQDYNCRKCLLNSACGRGCMAAATNLYDDPLANDGDCEYRKLQFVQHDLKSILPMLKSNS